MVLDEPNDSILVILKKLCFCINFMLCIFMIIIGIMDETIPKLKVFGTIVFLGLVFQLISLISNWFKIEDTEFSIRGISSSYQIEVMKMDCSTIEQNDKFLCFCHEFCDALQEIYEQGWGCSVLLLISMNLFLAEIFLTRRKIWRLEGYVLLVTSKSH